MWVKGTTTYQLFELGTEADDLEYTDVGAEGSNFLVGTTLNCSL